MKAAVALGRQVADLRWSAVSAPVRGKVCAHFLDTLGVMFAGYRAPETAAVLGMFDRGGDSGASVLGRSERIAPVDAAFCNAFLGRAHTYDDTYEQGPVHPGSAVVAAALAAADDSGATGIVLLEAVLAGYEVAVRISRAAGPGHYGSGLHSTGTINAFAAAAAAAKAMGLDADAITGALGHGGGGASGLRQYQEDGVLADSALNGARASAWGVRAAALARAGVHGPDGILDGAHGFFTVMCPSPDLDLLSGEDGDGVLQVSLKPYPSCRFTHGPVHVLRRLRTEAAIVPEDVEQVIIETFRQSMDVSDKPIVASRSDAILSHQYAAACMLANGAVTLDDFEEPARTDADRLALAARVSVRHAPTLEALYPAQWPHRVTLHLRDGRTSTGMSDQPPGSPDEPMHTAEVEAKFLSLAAPVLGEGGARLLRDTVADLHSANTVDGLTAILRGGSSARAVRAFYLSGAAERLGPASGE
jgi:2-methylcitrate dehydratase PrpD